MTDSPAAAPPPPYTSNAPPSETAFSTGRSMSLLSSPAGNDLQGVRALILDNARILFILAYNGQKALPKDVYILTIKSPHYARDRTPNKYHAAITFLDCGAKGRQAASMFVQSAQMDTMEEALLALLHKTQDMLGRRWQLPVSPVRSTNGSSVYLED